MLALNRYENFETTQCYSCATTIVMTVEFMNNRREDHKDFYCINGHGQRYLGKTEAQRLKEELEVANRRLASEKETTARMQRSAAAMKAQTTKLKNRIANGVCPCCQRTFVNLRRHMGTKHPDYKTQDIG